MKFSNILCSISLGVLIACGTVRASGSPRLDVYHKVAENETLTLLGFQSFVDNVMGNLSCEATTQQGQRTCTTRMMVRRSLNRDRLRLDYIEKIVGKNSAWYRNHIFSIPIMVIVRGLRHQVKVFPMNLTPRLRT